LRWILQVERISSVYEELDLMILTDHFPLVLMELLERFQEGLLLLLLLLLFWSKVECVFGSGLLFTVFFPKMEEE
jgi:hypothetical protein